MKIVPLEAIDGSAVEALLDRAFGGDRRSRTAYRLRAGTAPIATLSFAAIDQHAVVGTIQCWPVAHHADDGVETPLILVGPVAVDPSRQRGGIGRHLMSHALDAAETSGQGDALMLIGDPEYYGRFFGFTAHRTALWRMPGPVERRRLLARGEGVPEGPGSIGSRIA